MSTIRDTSVLHPQALLFCNRLMEECRKQGLIIGISETYRTVQRQDELFAQGRTTGEIGRTVTNARGTAYNSTHQWWIAFDFFRNDGKGAFDNTGQFFEKVGAVGKSIGLEWGGDWTTPDRPHFQLPNWGSTTQQLRNAYSTPDNFKATWVTQAPATIAPAQEMTQAEFFKLIGNLAVKETKRRTRWVLPSVCIAQAALETGNGRSPLMTKANAFFGIKPGSSWKGKVFSAATWEVYDGVIHNITANFRAYSSLEESIADYFDLIVNNSRYAGAVNNTEARSTITAIHQGGYATDPAYTTKIMEIITKHNLTVWDQDIIGQASTGAVIIPLNTFATGMRKALRLSNDKSAEDVLKATVTVSMHKNSRHDTVWEIQDLLTAHGYPVGRIDGIAGPLFDNATRLYQRDVVKLNRPDGVWTGKTGPSYKMALGA